MEKSYQEKHNVKTEFHRATGMPRRVTWYNELGEEDAPGDLPSEMRFNENGVLVYAFWKREGKFNREYDLPTRIYYDKDSGQPYHYRWEKDDLEHRERDKPSTIEFHRDTGALKELRFSKNGEPFRSRNRNDYFVFHEDGVARDIHDNPVKFEGFDVRWLPEQVASSAVTACIFSLRR